MRTLAFGSARYLQAFRQQHLRMECGDHLCQVLVEGRDYRASLTPSLGTPEPGAGTGVSTLSVSDAPVLGGGTRFEPGATVGRLNRTQTTLSRLAAPYECRLIDGLPSDCSQPQSLA